ncbi:MAG: alpha-amylase family glycosyl hydrolase [Paludibacteraceae bacterium]|nr:alpha-amylase family glycosyl hydrolase [Paludibacteraceae bacterium]MDD6747441.1 alpha-amylase family glycosyl hydrolase [Paludibacteraceae bacterium]
MGTVCALVWSAQAANWNDVKDVTPTEKARPAGISNGIYYGADGTSVTLCTYAASKTQSAKRVFLLGDMTDWKLKAEYQLYKDGNYFWITLTGLTPGKEYRFQYAVERADGVKKLISDLYSEKVLHPDDQYEPKKVDPDLLDYPTGKGANGYVTVIQPGKPKYEWSEATLNFKRPNKNNLVIYELWIYDYTEGRSLKGLMKRLDYIQNLGVNAIELMPICEFDGNYNWGYSPNHYFAPDRAYGSETMYKEFIDECHKRGIAVILDMVFNHATGLNPMNKLYPYGSDLANNPWFNVNVPHSDNVYEDWNHGFAPAKEMFTRALKYWLTEYKVDGFRLDLSHGLCSDQPNTSVANLKYYYDNGVKAVAPDAYMILEHWGGSMGTERPQLISYGMQCWNNTSNAYCQTAMGWLKDGDGFGEASKDGYVSYCESHDEERMQYKCKKYGNGDLQTNTAARLARVAENVAFNVLLNGSHMLWMWEEVGYDFSINCDFDHPNDYNESYRCSKKPRPEIRGYFTNANRVAAFTKCAQVITLRTQLMPSVFEGNPSSVSVNSGSKLRKIQWGSNVFAAANFDVTGNQAVTLPSGTWYDYLNGATKANGTYTLAPGELKVFTGTPVIAPTFDDINKRDHTPIENVSTDEMPKSYKILRDGQVLIVRGDKTYTITGQLVR